jgi:hypothetical protein
MVRFPPFICVRQLNASIKTLFRGVIGTVSRVEVLIRARINHSRPRLYRTTDQLITENPTEKVN